MVRWYEEAPAPVTDVLASAGYRRLRWEQRRAGPVAMRTHPVYGVVLLNSIARRQYIAPDFSTWVEGEDPSYFHVSLSKWDRMPKDDSQRVQRGGEPDAMEED